MGKTIQCKNYIIYILQKSKDNTKTKLDNLVNHHVIIEDFDPPKSYRKNNK